MKCAIFDLDGTLIDSMGVWEEADMSVLGQYGHNPDEEYVKKIVTLNFTQGAQYIIDKFQIPTSVEMIKEQIFDHVYESYADHLILKEGVKEYLLKLKQEGVILTIATSSIRQMCEAVLKRNEIYSYFQEIIFAEEEGVGKEEPDLFLSLAKKVNVDPRDCVVFEDSIHAVLGAKKAGMVVVGVFDSYSANQKQTMSLHCDKYIDSFQSLDYEMTKNLFLKEELNP